LIPLTTALIRTASMNVTCKAKNSVLQFINEQEQVFVSKV
jgi:hypothetical protein